MVSLNSMNVDAICEKLKQIEGLDQSMLPQYCATIKKVMYTLTCRLEAGLRAQGQVSVDNEFFVLSFSKMDSLLKWESCKWKHDSYYFVSSNCSIIS